MNSYWLLKKQIKWNKNDDNTFSPPCTVFFHNFPHDDIEEIDILGVTVLLSMFTAQL